MIRSRMTLALTVACWLAYCGVAAGERMKYAIQFEGITNVNDFSETFPSFAVNFLVDSPQRLDDSAIPAISHAISGFSVIQGDKVIFQADNGSLVRRNDGLEIHAGDAEHFLDNAFFAVSIDEFLAGGSFASRLQEFRIPKFGGSIAWNVNGTVSSVPEPPSIGLAGLACLCVLAARRGKLSGKRLKPARQA